MQSTGIPSFDINKKEVSVLGVILIFESIVSEWHFTVEACVVRRASNRHLRSIVMVRMKL